MPHSEHHEHVSDVAFEPRDVSAFGVIATGVGILIGTLVSIFLLYFYFIYLRGTRPEPPPRAELAPEYNSIRQPLLQPSPRSDLKYLREYEDQVLNGYRWVDQGKGVVSIHIERAIELVVERGLPPARGDAASLKLWPPRAGSRQTGFDQVQRNQTPELGAPR